jgi:hypothetical protein
MPRPMAVAERTGTSLRSAAVARARAAGPGAEKKGIF